jgi:predicted DNA binding CopG/RHH family protein
MYHELSHSPKRTSVVLIRLTSEDLGALRARALQEGIPYQTLISSVLHKYVCGRLLDRP